ncbi:glycosyltransferase family 2 protein [Lysinibacillus sp. NPDC059133]|uniref:glycosyltransferase family 2 protein n=1 Tax=Lysinibacillus sp. NPDC059133 TaxID=3346737 RepID=UPI00369F8E32
MDTVSVVIPVYNKGKYVIESVQSVLQQTYPYFEILLINDGSTDNGEEFMLQLQRQDSRIRYLHQSNQGVSKSRNKGIEQATGKYICFLDADDLYHPHFLQKMIASIRDNEVCYCGQNLVYDNGKHKKGPMKFLKGDILEAYFYNKCTPNTNSWMFKRDFILQHHIQFNENLDWGEDMLFYAQVLTFNTAVQCVKDYLTFYRVGVKQSLSTVDIDKLYKDIDWLSEYKVFLEKVDLPLSRKQAVLSAIDGYRLPALLIYGLWLNKKIISKRKYDQVRQEVENLIKPIQLNNGLRSLKLYFYSKFI